MQDRRVQAQLGAVGQAAWRRWIGRRTSPRLGTQLLRLVGVGIPALAGATGLVWLLEDRFGVLNASPVFVLPVVVTALVSGTAGAIAAAVIGILLYDFLFTQPIHTLTISDPGEWLNLVLLLFVALVVGQLTALERNRTRTAESREREARELFLVSRALATRTSTPNVLREVAELIATAAGFVSVRIALGADDASERDGAVAGDPSAATSRSLHWILRRMPGDQPAVWVRIHAAGSRAARGQQLATYRVRIEAAGKPLGSIWASGEISRGRPDRSATRLMSAAADQVGQALAQDQLAADAGAAEVARQSDALKSALLQSVSHDLRAPLATIRAAAGSLLPDSGLDADARRATTEAIDREVARLDRIVANLLDLGRIEGGALRPDLDVYALDDLVGATLTRMSSRFEGRSVHVDVGPIAVTVDPVFLDEALTNVLDNALKFAGPSAHVGITAERSNRNVALVVADDGPGIPEALIARVFEPFYRLPAPNGERRAGTGIGLAVARGLVEAMGGRISARRSDFGGLAIAMALELARLPADLAVGAG